MWMEPATVPPLKPSLVAVASSWIEPFASGCGFRGARNSPIHSGASATWVMPFLRRRAGSVDGPRRLRKNGRPTAASVKPGERPGGLLDLDGHRTLGTLEVEGVAGLLVLGIDRAALVRVEVRAGAHLVAVDLPGARHLAVHRGELAVGRVGDVDLDPLDDENDPVLDHLVQRPGGGRAGEEGRGGQGRGSGEDQLAHWEVSEA